MQLCSTQRAKVLRCRPKSDPLAARWLERLIPGRAAAPSGRRMARPAIALRRNQAARADWLGADSGLGAVELSLLPQLLLELALQALWDRAGSTRAHAVRPTYVQPS